MKLDWYIRGKTVKTLEVVHEGDFWELKFHGVFLSIYWSIWVEHSFLSSTWLTRTSKCDCIYLFDVAHTFLSANWKSRKMLTSVCTYVKLITFIQQPNSFLPHTHLSTDGCRADMHGANQATGNNMALSISKRDYFLLLYQGFYYYWQHCAINFSVLAICSSHQL